jgi:hypothetical protein
VLLWPRVQAKPLGGLNRRVWPQSCPAITAGSILTASHQACSSPLQCSSRWCKRHSGIVDSLLTIRPKARGCAKRR